MTTCARLQTVFSYEPLRQNHRLTEALPTKGLLGSNFDLHVGVYAVSASADSVQLCFAGRRRARYF